MSGPVAEWLSCVRGLDRLLALMQQVPSTLLEAAEAQHAAESLEQKLTQLGGQPPLSQEGWRRLVLQEQVLLKICKALKGICLRASQQQQRHWWWGQQQQQQQQQQPSSSELARRGAISVSYTFAASLLARFLNRAYADLPLCRSDNPTGTKPFREALAAQLQASGLLLQGGMPMLLDAATDALEAQMRAADTPSGTAGSSSSSSSSDAKCLLLGESHSTVSTNVLQLLHIYVRLQLLLPPTAASFSTYALSAPALARTVHTAMQYVSARMLQQQQQQQQQQPEALPPDAQEVLFELLRQATLAVIMPAEAIADAVAAKCLPGLGTVLSHTPDAAAMFLSPHYVPSLVLATAATGYSVLAMQQQQQQQQEGPVGGGAAGGSGRRSLAAGGGAASAAGSSSSSSNSRQEPRPASSWWQAGEMQAALTPCQQQLFELLGVDSRVVCWAGAALVNGSSVEAASTNLDSLLEAYSNNIKFWNDHATIQQKRQHQQASKAHARVHLLLPSLLLHCAGQTHSAGRVFVGACSTSAHGSLVALSAWQLFHQKQEGARVWFPAAELATELLPTVLDVSARLRKLLTARVRDSPAGAAAAAVGPDVSECRAAHTHLTRLLVALVGRLHCRACPSAAAAAVADLGAEVFLPVLPGSLCQVLSALECFVRITASAAAAATKQTGGASTGLSSTAVATATQLGGQFTPGNQPLARLALSTAPGSPERKQLYSLLASMQKLATLIWHGPLAGRDLQVAEACTGALVACCPAALLRFAWFPEPAVDVAAAVTMESASSALDAAFIHTYHQPDASEWTAVEVASVLPSLVLAGRCCLLWAQNLQPETPAHLQMKSYQSLSATMTSRLGPQSSLEYLLSPCEEWLGTPSVAQQLTAVGYEPQSLQQAVTEAVAAGAEAAAAGDWAAGKIPESSTSTSLVQKLQAVGAGLTSLAVRGLCNNAACSCCDGPTELSIVSGKGGHSIVSGKGGHKCAGCGVAYYCSPRCQKQAWRQHKPVCRALAAAGSTGG